MAEFIDVEREIGETLQKLKHTTDPSGRRHLLREMRCLLSEADRILSLATDDVTSIIR